MYDSKLRNKLHSQTQACIIDAIYITGSQNTTKIYCTVLYSMLYMYMFQPFFRPSSGCICLALRILYHDDKFRLFG